MKNYAIVSAVLLCSFVKIGMFLFWILKPLLLPHRFGIFLYFLFFILMIFFYSFCYNVIWNSATSISCYVCNATDSSSPFQCGEWFERYDTPDIVPQDCSNVYGAKYCVKHIGRFEGKCSWSTNNDLLLIHGYMGLVWSGLSGNTNKHVFLSFHIYSFIIYIFFSFLLYALYYEY